MFTIILFAFERERDFGKPTIKVIVLEMSKQLKTKREIIAVPRLLRQNLEC